MEGTDHMSETETGTEKTIKVFLVDDHEVVRRGLLEMLAVVPGMEVVGEAGTCAQARARIPAVRPDVAILDGRLPDGSGIDLCRDLRSELPDTYCMILTSYDDTDAALASILAGASGYVLKELDGTALVDAVRQVAMGRSLMSPATIASVMDRVKNGSPADAKLAELTEREREVLELITEGLTNKQIGERMFLAEKTVKNYVSSVLAKLGLERRTQAAVFGAEVFGQDPNK